MDHELTPTNPTLFCDKCFHEFNYQLPRRRGPVPHCDFKAYPLYPDAKAWKGPSGAGTGRTEAWPGDAWRDEPIEDEDDVQPQTEMETETQTSNRNPSSCPETENDGQE